MSIDRRRFLVSSSGALAGVAFSRGLFAQAQPEAVPETAFKPLRRTVGIFTGRGGTIGWHADSKGSFLVDAQFPATARICLEGIKQRNGGRPIDFLVNTHHHGDHVAGNGVLRPEVRKILAHVNVPKYQKAAAASPAGTGRPPEPPVCANAVYEQAWHEQVGGEVMDVRHYGPAHTGGDSVVTFEKANVVHMGDLVFNRIHPYIDRPMGASIRNWITLLDTVAAAHSRDTIYVFGHGQPKFGETGTRQELAYMRDYLGALLEFVRAQMKAGKPREEIVKITDPLPRFPDHGPLIARVLGPAYDELA